MAFHGLINLIYGLKKTNILHHLLHWSINYHLSCKFSNRLDSRHRRLVWTQTYDYAEVRRRCELV